MLMADSKKHFALNSPEAKLIKSKASAKHELIFKTNPKTGVSYDQYKELIVGKELDDYGYGL